MAEPSDDEWHLVPATEYFQPAAAVRDRKQILEWGKTNGHWSGCGKHIKSTDIKGKFHVDEVLGNGATGWVERVTFRSVTMARKRIRIRGMFVEQLREEANIMEKLVHRHIVELVGTYTHGQKELNILTYPVATCNLQSFLDDIEEVRSGTADAKDISKRFEALGFKGISLPQARTEEQRRNSLERPLHFLASVIGCVTEAVVFVHSQGVRHQDLKPRNILLSPRQVYLADFGISRDLRDATHSLTEGFAGGTPLYIAPEVAQREVHHMSPADIYSLGCVFVTVAAALYGAPHGQYEKVMGEKDFSKKAPAIKEYLNDLRRRALRLGRAAHDAPTCAPKHLLNLIEQMLSQDPKLRPTGSKVNSTLHELGGIDQMYHGKCCKKDSAYISQLIGKWMIGFLNHLALLIFILDNKMKGSNDEKSDQAKRIHQLEAQHELDVQQIEKLSKTQETYQVLVERERKHAVEQYANLLERRTKELEAATAARKSLEAEVAQLRRQRQLPRNQQKGKPPHVPNGPAQSLAQFNPSPRRTSRVPLPVRPSTPLRPHFGRESSSGNNTLLSSVNSAFSKTTAESNGSQDSEKSFRSSTPESPSSIHAPPSPVLSHGHVHVDEGSGRKPAEGTTRTWAQMLKQPLAAKNSSNKPVQDGAKTNTVLAKVIKT